MKVSELFDGSGQNLVKCRPDSTILDVAKLLHENNIGAMPVCSDGAMTGIVSERDLVRSLATTGGDISAVLVSEIMSTTVFTCDPDDSVETAQQTMNRHRFRHLPVVDGDRVVGMLSIRDTLRTRLQEAEFEVNVLRDVVIAARHT